VNSSRRKVGYDAEVAGGNREVVCTILSQESGGCWDKASMEVGERWGIISLEFGSLLNDDM